MGVFKKKSTDKALEQEQKTEMENFRKWKAEKAKADAIQAKLDKKQKAKEELNEEILIEDADFDDGEIDLPEVQPSQTSEEDNIDADQHVLDGLKYLIRSEFIKLVNEMESDGQE